MTEINPFDHQSLIYKLMKYLYKIQQFMLQVQIIWIAIDIIQFLTIITSLLGYVIKNHLNIVEQDLFDNALNIFFNYSKIYEWLVISGALSALIVIIGLISYLYVQEFKKRLRKQNRQKILNYCAFVATVVIGLFQIFSQVMANNLINIFAKIFKRQIQMNVIVIFCFFLNVFMMIFVSVFNNNRRIFRFSLVVVSLGLNMLPFTITCILLIVLSFYYQSLDKVVYKKLFYFQIILTCLWSILQVNDNEKQQLKNRFINLCIGAIALGLYFFYYKRDFIEGNVIQENKYLIKVYEKKLKRQDKKIDYFLADKYFIKFFQHQKQSKQVFRKDLNFDYYLTTSSKQWHQSDFKQKIIQKIKSQKKYLSNSPLKYIQYFRLAFQLKLDTVNILNQLYFFMTQSKNQTLYTIYQINKLTHFIQMKFQKQVEKEENGIKVHEIIYLEEIYKQFYQHYGNVLSSLASIFLQLDLKQCEINQKIQQKLHQFSKQQNLLQKNLKLINEIVGQKLQYKLYNILSQISNKYTKTNSQLQGASGYLTNSKQQKINLLTQKQKYDFSYIIISNQIIKYASVKFLSIYSFKQSYLIGQNMSAIFPSKLNLYVMDCIQKNINKKVFYAQILVKNQKGTFQIVNATFYLLPEFKGSIDYLIKIKKINEMEAKNLTLFNCQTMCLEGFNKKIIDSYKFDSDKINWLLQNDTIQFSDLFVLGNDDKDFFSLAKKQQKTATRNKKIVESAPFTTQKFRQQKPKTQIKALLKMDYLSRMKRAFARNILIQQQKLIQINNIAYKILKIQDTVITTTNNTTLKTLQNLTYNQTQKKVSINNLININSLDQQNGHLNTLDLYQKYKQQRFYCPLINPYKPQILDKLSNMCGGNKNKNRRLNHLFLIKLLFFVSCMIFFVGLMAFVIKFNQIEDEIVYFQKEASSINNQYSFFTEGMLEMYKINHLMASQKQFVSYFMESRNLTLQQAQKQYQIQLNYTLKQKFTLIQSFQSSYLDFPIIKDTQPINLTLKTPLFILQGNSHTTLYYDLIIFLIDNFTPDIKLVIAQNNQLFDKMIKILRPDGRYKDKISKLIKIPIIILVVSSCLIIIIFTIIYLLIYQILQIKQDIILIYKFIEKKQIIQNQVKIQQIYNLIQGILANENIRFKQIKKINEQMQSNSSISNSSLLSLSMFDLTKQQIVTSVNSTQNNSIDNEDKQQEKIENQNQNAQLLPKKSISLKSKKLSSSNSFLHKLFIFINTFIRNPIYIIFCIILIISFYYIYVISTNYSNYYIQTFLYFQKIRASNFQFRYEYIISQRNAFYYSIKNQQLVKDQTHLNNLQILKQTQFQYERPEFFSINFDEKLCSNNITSEITDPFIKNFKCEQIDASILLQQFSIAYEKYQQNLYKITNQTYESLIKDPALRQTYFQSIYQFHAFKNYFKNLFKYNFKQNLIKNYAQIEKTMSYIFMNFFGLILVILVLGFKIYIPRIESQVNTLISCIKMIPPQTLFTMKIAFLFKKRNILQKFDRL